MKVLFCSFTGTNKQFRIYLNELKKIAKEDEEIGNMPDKERGGWLERKEGILTREDIDMRDNSNKEFIPDHRKEMLFDNAKNISIQRNK